MVNVQCNQILIDNTKTILLMICGPFQEIVIRALCEEACYLLCFVINFDLICDALPDLVPFVQFRKHEKDP